MENPFKFLFSTDNKKNTRRPIKSEEKTGPAVDIGRPPIHKMKPLVNAERPPIHRMNRIAEAERSAINYPKNTNSDEDDKKIMSRRNFIKAGVALGVVSLYGDSVLEKGVNIVSAIDQKNKDKAEEAELKKLIEELKLEGENMPEIVNEISEEDARPIKELINYHVEGQIDLTGTNTLEVLTSYCKKRYK